MVTGAEAFVALRLLAAAAYGISDFAGGLASRRSDTLTTLLYGDGIGLAVTAVLLPLVPGVLTGRGVLCAVAAGVAGVVGFGLMYRLMASEPLNLVSPMTAVLAAAVPLAFGVLTGEAPHLLTWVGMGAGLVAVVLFTYSPDAEQQRLRMRVIGLAFLSWGRSGSARRRCPGRRRRRPLRPGQSARVAVVGRRDRGVVSGGDRAAHGRRAGRARRTDRPGRPRLSAVSLVLVAQ